MALAHDPDRLRHRRLQTRGYRSGSGGRELARARQDVPRSYPATLEAVRAAVAGFEGSHGPAAAVGIAMPGLIGADGALLRAVNLPWLERRPLGADLAQTLGKPVAIANDANCFALSEAIDGAAAGADVVFGATLGTGVGGGIVIGGRPLVGANAIAGEWGHNPLPETPGGRWAAAGLRLRAHRLHRDLAERRGARPRLSERLRDRDRRPRGRAPGRARRARGPHGARALPAPPRHGACRDHQRPRPGCDRARRRPVVDRQSVCRGAEAVGAAGRGP